MRLSLLDIRTPNLTRVDNVTTDHRLRISASIAAGYSSLSVLLLTLSFVVRDFIDLAKVFFYMNAPGLLLLDSLHLSGDEKASNVRIIVSFGFVTAFTAACIFCCAWLAQAAMWRCRQRTT